MKIKKLFGGVNVEPFRWALRAHPEIWNRNTERTASPDSPHREVNDVWFRYQAKPLSGGPHESVWYPEADLVPVRELALSLMTVVKGERLGGVLMTHIPPGKQVYPHSDDGWHAGYYEKFALQIESAPGQAFCFDGEQCEAMPGEVYTFDNSYPHWVTNPTPYDRITLIICIKTGVQPCLGQPYQG